MSRYALYIAALALTLLSALMTLVLDRDWMWLLIVSGALAALGTWDLLQTRSTLRRNYPLLAHFRYGLESIGPEMRQYFIQADTAEVPFSRLQRALVYQRSKSVIDTRPFGTLQDVYGPDYEWINHSMVPSQHVDPDFRVLVGENTAQPYSASVFNISAMSFGSLSANAIRALNKGAKAGGFYHDTGEGSISPYHREHGGDLVWEIGSGYFGCRDGDGRFSEERFVANATDPQVRMIEVKLSQGAKPGHGGMLPAAKVSPEIAVTRGVLEGVDCISTARHTEFGNPVELLQFVARLRRLSGGKPTGFKLAIGHPWEWFGVAKAMQETGLLPDFIVVDGAEGGTGAAPAEFVEHVGVPMHEALMLVHNTLVGLGPPAAASCSRWAASSRRAAIPTAARPASPPRIRGAGASSTWPTRGSGSTASTRTPCTRCATCSAPAAWAGRRSWVPSTSCAGSPRWKSARWPPCTGSWPPGNCWAGSRNTPCSSSSGPRPAATVSLPPPGSRRCAG